MAPIKEWFGLYNVIFSWFEEKYGYQAMAEYWKYIGDNCFDDVVEKIKAGGLKGIQEYFEHTFDLDQGEYVSELQDDRLIFSVEKCPDYEFMKSSENPYFKPIGDYCKHHEVINSIISEKSGYSFCMEECDGAGKCKWVFKKSDKAISV